MERLILVDRDYKETGTAEKMEAHREAKLHRAFSVFVLNSSGQLMLQKRAAHKYHSPGLWSNTCCSHPRPGEGVLDAAHRRLKEEMGFDTGLQEAFSFVYKIKFDKDLWEHEFDHVIVGRFDGRPDTDPEEVGDWKWADLDKLKKDMEDNPERYTYWFRVSFDKFLDFVEKNK